MRGEILKNASLSSAADKTLGHPTNDTRAGINKGNLADENTDKRAG